MSWPDDPCFDKIRALNLDVESYSYYGGILDVLYGETWYHYRRIGPDLMHIGTGVAAWAHLAWVRYSQPVDKVEDDDD